MHPMPAGAPLYILAAADPMPLDPTPIPRPPAPAAGDDAEMEYAHTVRCRAAAREAARRRLAAATRSMESHAAASRRGAGLHTVAAEQHPEDHASGTNLTRASHVMFVHPMSAPTKRPDAVPAPPGRTPTSFPGSRPHGGPVADLREPSADRQEPNREALGALGAEAERTPARGPEARRAARRGGARRE
ncbi:unnamed protein product [Prorocentrum cordatum]|uniref:Uncharacterized protein n=1 Tax=Prorocentrum cordatum TaxID=2364126 RepID=A0ABN9QS33_9DINO|nr:unnamed protein product [Polarella glacialis]